MNVRGGSTILRAPRVPKNYSKKLYLEKKNTNKKCMKLEITDKKCS